MHDWLRQLLQEPGDPGRIYLRSLEELRTRGLEADYALTEAIVYATELRYALDLLGGQAAAAWNFADTGGSNDDSLCQVLDAVEPLRLAFVGAGPYPVTARMVRQRYPGAQLTCLDNHVTGYLVGQAVTLKLGLEAEWLLADGAQVDYSAHTAVLVAAMVSGKRRVVERALATCGGPVVVRGPVDLEHPRLLQLPACFTEEGVLRP